MWRSPRAIKRFLNAFAVREHLARSNGAELDPKTLLKLCLLEVRHLSEFRLLSQKATADRRALVAEWEQWAREGGELPQGIGEETRARAAGPPSLNEAPEQVERYLSVAATLLGDFASEARLRARLCASWRTSLLPPIPQGAPRFSS
ncbi:hypothetical protein [Actinomadura fibrosa]|uniref:Uncharacterized protein n=1 Tax=Actinomadura fibrosa TaxID=111802 RepID=A0ABW2XQS6_9ACTN|nr:hypothetical protein [Actinomadura fibrosa]